LHARRASTRGLEEFASMPSRSRAVFIWLFAAFACAAAHAAIPDSERTVLRHFYDATGGERWRSTQAGVDVWFGDDDPCRWFGIFCDAGRTHVEVIALGNGNLEGELPPDLKVLTALRALVVDGNRLHGTLPSLAGLTRLQTVFVQHNEFSGSIPSLAGLDNLAWFAADHNRLGGHIPSLAGAPNLQYFQIDHNAIDGRVPRAPPRLTRFSATLCPNRLDTRPSADASIDAGWNEATGWSPWWSGVDGGCAPTEPARAPHVAFATSATGAGDVHAWDDAKNTDAHGLAAADTVCRARAAAANLANPDAFVAWLSDRDNDAYCRALGLAGKKADNCGQAGLAATGPWLRSDGTPFAAALDQALDANRVFAPLDVDESGTALPTGAESFTATGVDGTFSALGGLGDCGRWQSATDQRGAWFGSNAATAQDWTFDGHGAGCEARQHLICLETGAGPPLPPAAPPAVRQQAFVTSVEVSGNLGGVDGADATCRDLAAAAHLYQPASYKALLALSSAPRMTDRFVADGPWFRLDGLLFAHDKTELVSGPVTLPLNLTDGGDYLGTSVALTGATREGLLEGGHNCADFTAGATIVEGALANWTAFGSNWAGPAEVACTATPSADALSRRLFCLSDADLLFHAEFD
jgi:hypothetical protein